MQKRGLLKANHKEFPLLVPATASKFSPRAVGAVSAAFHSGGSWTCSSRSSERESGDGVWEQIKSVCKLFFFSSFRWEVGAVRSSKGAAAGSQHKNCCRYR